MAKSESAVVASSTTPKTTAKDSKREKNEKALRAELTPIVDRIVAKRLAERRAAKAPYLRLKKAKGDCLPLVRWLLSCGPREILAGVVMAVLMDADLALSIEKSGGYGGDLGYDLQRDWQSSIEQAVENPEKAGMDEETRRVAILVLGLQTASQR